jgi:hypothetical protein
MWWLVPESCTSSSFELTQCLMVHILVHKFSISLNFELTLKLNIGHKMRLRASSHQRRSMIRVSQMEMLLKDWPK